VLVPLAAMPDTDCDAITFFLYEVHHLRAVDMSRKAAQPLLNGLVELYNTA
jgi:hypothetical protein